MPPFAMVGCTVVPRGVLEERWHQLSSGYVSTPIREGDSLVGAVVVFRDVSDRTRAEAALEYTEQRFRSSSPIFREPYTGVHAMPTGPCSFSARPL